MFFFQAEDGIRDLVRSRGLGDVYKRQKPILPKTKVIFEMEFEAQVPLQVRRSGRDNPGTLSLIHI